MYYKKMLKVVLLVCLALLGFCGWHFYHQKSMIEKLSGELYGPPPVSYKDSLERDSIIKKMIEEKDFLENDFYNQKNED